MFYNGQVYDAYTFVSDLIKSAKKRIVLIDNYVDETVQTLLNKRDNNVSAIIYTQQISRQFQLDIDRHNAQYAPIDVEIFRLSHDRFLCIDDDVYHIGASIKDLGKKWFDFSKMATNSSKSESPHFGTIFGLQEAFSRCINNSFANWLSELVNAEDCIKAFQGICLIQI